MVNNVNKKNDDNPSCTKNWWVASIEDLYYVIIFM